jgi:hypothetical protein
VADSERERAEGAAMKPLPDKFSREVIVAWVVESSEAKNATFLDASPIIPWCNEYSPTTLDYDNGKAPKFTVIPAAPDTFQIYKELPSGELVKYCYQFDGFMTDPYLNKLVGGMGC